MVALCSFGIWKVSLILCTRDVSLLCSCSYNTDDATSWVRQVRQVIEAFELGTPQYRLGLWRQTFRTESYLKIFEAPEERTFKHTLTTTLPGVIERACSKSYIAIRSDAERAQICKDLADILERADKTWINERAGTFEYPYINTVVVMRKK